MADPEKGPGGLPFVVDLRRVNMFVGYAAIGLPVALLLLTLLTDICFSGSISHYYYTRIGGDYFVGTLSFVGLLLVFFYSFKGEVDGYLEHRPADMILLKVAGLAAFAIAFVPTNGSGCDFEGQVARVFLTATSGSESYVFGQPPVTGTIGFDFWATLGVTNKVLRQTHLIAAGVMFLILAYFSLVVFTRTNTRASLTKRGDPVPQKITRNRYYRILGGLILLSIVAIAFKALVLQDAGEGLKMWETYRLTFVFEALALISFGLSWLIKGRFLKYFDDP
ncbi:MAG: hypothetical protein QNJ44_14680 [Rhodobacter sp.]|nr:hypothetical protein [Rhodobacter sp.]